MGPSGAALTEVLARVRSGDPAAWDELLEALYPDLHARAEAAMRTERAGHTLQPTALVNEAFLRLAASGKPDWSDRSHFLRASAIVMRRVLVDCARARNRQRRGGGWVRVTLHDVIGSDATLDAEILDLERALQKLSNRDAQAACVAELRQLAGMTVAEVAEALSISETTVKKNWRYAQAWLRRELTKDEDA